jgi:hypothetical protein
MRRPIWLTLPSYSGDGDFGMKVWVFEDNLMWSARLTQTLKALGHEPIVVTAIPANERADVAILNLGSPAFKDLVPALQKLAVYTIGHAGHKERDLLKLGKEAGCDRIATNSELTFKLESLLSLFPI